MKTYIVERNWTVLYRSVCEVEATSKMEACRIALEEDDDYSDQKSCDDGDGPVYIGSIQRDGEYLIVPKCYSEEGDEQG